MDDKTLSEYAREADHAYVCHVYKFGVAVARDRCVVLMHHATWDEAQVAEISSGMFIQGLLPQRRTLAGIPVVLDADEPTGKWRLLVPPQGS